LTYNDTSTSPRNVTQTHLAHNVTSIPLGDHSVGHGEVYLTLASHTTFSKEECGL